MHLGAARAGGFPSPRNQRRARGVCNLFVPNFYLGCEARDPTNSASNTKVNPFGLQLKPWAETAWQGAEADRSPTPTRDCSGKIFFSVTAVLASDV